MLKIDIDGFRGFSGNGIDIDNLNILIGENSGGKSSFIKLLLLLKQSMETPNKDKKINPNGHLVDLGGFDSFINHNNIAKEFSVSYLISGEEYKKTFLEMYGLNEEDEELQNDEFHFVGDPISIKFIFGKEKNTVFNTYITISCDSIGTISITPDEVPFINAARGIEGEIVLSHVKHGKHTIKDRFTTNGFLLLVSPEALLKYETDNQINYFMNEMAYLLIGQNYIAKSLYSLKYINPIKFTPERIMLKRDNSKSYKIEDYGTFISTLSYLSESKDENDQKIMSLFRKAVKEVGIADDVFLKLYENAPVTELQVEVGGVWNSIVDVGYGVGLQIPILLQAIISSVQNKDDTIIIEQPEIHLHPKLHANFIEVLLKYGVNSRFIIETHSEHILRKLQVLASKSLLNINRTKIYYFKNTCGDFDIGQHFLNEDGQLNPPFPKGFYDNAYNLTKELF